MSRTTPLLTLSLWLASSAAMATTEIDVAFMVTQKTLDTYGREAVFNTLQTHIDTANTLFNAGIPGLDVKFVAKAIQPYDGVLDETTDGCANNGKANSGAFVETLTNSGHYTKTPVYYALGLNDLCLTSDEQTLVADTGTISGADFIVAVDSITPGSDNAVANPAAGITMHYPRIAATSRDYVLAHEMGHLLGLGDLYDNAANECATTNAGRLMCDNTPNANTATDAASLFSDTERAVVKQMINITDRQPNDVSIVGLSSQVIGAGAGLATARDAGDRVITLAVDNTTLSESNPKATFTVTMSSAATEPVLVNVYSSAVNSTAGTEYLDDVAQGITLAAGETSKTFTLTANQLSGFTGTKMVSVGVFSAAGATVAANSDMDITLTGSQSSSGGGSSGSATGGSGGGAINWLLLTLLAGLTAGRRRLRQ